MLGAFKVWDQIPIPNAVALIFGPEIIESCLSCPYREDRLFCNLAPPAVQTYYSLPVLGDGPAFVQGSYLAGYAGVSLLALWGGARIDAMPSEASWRENRSLLAAVRYDYDFQNSERHSMLAAISNRERNMRKTTSWIAGITVIAAVLATIVFLSAPANADTAAAE